MRIKRAIGSGIFFSTGLALAVGLGVGGSVSETYRREPAERTSRPYRNSGNYASLHATSMRTYLPDWVMGGVSISTKAWANFETGWSLGWVAGRSQKSLTSILDPGENVGRFPIDAGESYLRFEWSGVPLSGLSSSTVTFGPQLTVPVDPWVRNRGQIVSLGHPIRFTWKASPSVSFYLKSNPRWNFTREGGVVDRGRATAHTAFEHELALTASYTHPKGKFGINLPLKWQQVHHADFRKNATDNELWKQWIWVAPEAWFALSSRSELALRYVSDTLADIDLKVWDPIRALGKGSVQLNFKMAL